MKTIKRILDLHGIDSVEAMTYDDYIKLEVDGVMPLVIEKVGENRISVAHYYEQRGDLMSDPEIVFHVQGEEWVPVEYTQHPHIYHRDNSGLHDVKRFVKTWSRNLEQQGFVETARQAVSASESMEVPA